MEIVPLAWRVEYVAPQSVLGNSLIHLPPLVLAASCSRFLRASSTIPLARSTCPLARGWATETYRMSIPLFSQYSELVIVEVGAQVCDDAMG
jgi:hypothetical protein